MEFVIGAFCYGLVILASALGVSALASFIGFIIYGFVMAAKYGS